MLLEVDFTHIETIDELYMELDEIISSRLRFSYINREKKIFYLVYLERQKLLKNLVKKLFREGRIKLKK